MGFVKLEINIRFRAFGMTFGNWADKVAFPLPPIVSVIEKLLHPHIVGTYNDHGVKIVVSIVNTPVV